ncbi:MAG: TIGR00730 family Rossman fold protein [Bacteroidetes bacterium]|nr:MAG: TIGR00730 family Rossman fold protein [Bacteroidota bacterium]
MNKEKNICVFCGSSKGNKASFVEATKELANVIFQNNGRLVYGGGNVGLMGVIAEEMLSIGGHVTGIMPQHLADYELFHEGIQEKITVKTMAERKERLLEMSDFFIALPGGFGTLDEISEVITSNQLMLMHKPMGILNVDGYFDGLLDFFNHAVDCQLLREVHKDMIVFDENPSLLLEKLEKVKNQPIDDWIEDTKE